jgi:hypothetical protein
MNQQQKLDMMHWCHVLTLLLLPSPLAADTTGRFRVVPAAASCLAVATENSTGNSTADGWR